MPESLPPTSYDANNRQLTFGDKTLFYDTNGNLQTITDSSGTTTYTWNARNQLTGISGPSVNATFVYDGLGRREKKTINSNLTEFLYDGLNPVQETSGATILANILPGLGIDEFLTRTDVVAGVTSSFLTDALGSPVAVTNGSGVVQTEYTYEPFGKTTVSGASNSSSYQYTGRENDGTGVYYYRARYYHPILQRFISEDPIEFQGQNINLYGYVFNNPNLSNDPMGLLPPIPPQCTGFSRCYTDDGMHFIPEHDEPFMPRPNELPRPPWEPKWGSRPQVPFNRLPPPAWPRKQPTKGSEDKPNPDKWDGCDEYSAGFCWPVY